MKHPEHIICVKSSLYSEREHGFSDYQLEGGDIIVAQREVLERDPAFRQVMPMIMFTCKGKVWAYERTSTSGESRLHNKVAVFAGGHWDLDDIVTNKSIIDLNASFEKALNRELSEEVKIDAKVISAIRLEKSICADDTEVDRLHVAIVTVVELSDELVKSKEDKIKPLGFKTPSELLGGAYNLETWARMACELLI